MRRALALIVCATACGGASEPDERDQAPETQPRVTLEAEPRGRTVVARVNGTPIYGDCVARQARAHDLSRREALDECIGFELLAQKADAEGYRTHPEVLRERKQELVRAFVTETFLPQHERPEQIPDPLVRQTYEEMIKRDVAKAYATNSLPEHKLPEPFREVTYFRHKVPSGALKGGIREWRGLWALLRVSDYFEGRSDVTHEEFQRVAERLAGSGHTTRSRNPIYFGRISRVVPIFKQVAFDELDVGQVSRPIRTRWGWDVMAVLEQVEPFDTSLADMEDDVRDTMFQAWSQKEFLRWVARLRGDSEKVVNEEWLARLVAADQAQRSLLE